VGWERGSSQLSAAGTQKAPDAALQALRDLLAESERAQAVAESAATQAAQDATNAICDKRETLVTSSTHTPRTLDTHTHTHTRCL
jgi:hypothetical protein